MDTLEAIYARRSVKCFDASHNMPIEIQHKIFEAAKQAPSSFNIQHWRLINIVDTEIRQKLRLAAWNQAQVTDASMVLMICVDLNAHADDPNQYWRNAPEAVKNMLVGAIGNFYHDNPQLQRDEAMRSAGLIAQTIMLSVTALGYDSCPMIGFEFDKVSALIKLPKDHEIAMMITIGKPLQPAREKGGFISDHLFLRENSF
ncbi:MAG: nitroreductase [Alphaproteobacteria bacterium]|jgi:nitroreductase